MNNLLVFLFIRFILSPDKKTKYENSYILEVANSANSISDLIIRKFKKIFIEQ